MRMRVARGRDAGGGGRGRARPRAAAAMGGAARKKRLLSLWLLAAAVLLCCVRAAPTRFAKRQAVSGSEFRFEVTWPDDVPSTDRLGFENCIAEAKRILEQSWPSAVPVHVQIIFLNSHESAAFSGYGFGRFTLTRAIDGVTHTIAAAEAISGEELHEPGEPEVRCVFSMAPLWHVDFATAPAFTEAVDFFTALLHEIMHGLVFAGLAEEREGGIVYGGGTPLAFDRFVGSTSRECLIDGVFGANPTWTTPNAEALDALTTVGDIAFLYVDANANNQVFSIPLFSTSEYRGGVSIYHTPEWTSGQPRRLMVPSLTNNYYVRELDDDLLRIQAAILAAPRSIPLRPCPKGTFSAGGGAQLSPTVAPDDGQGDGDSEARIGSLSITTFAIIVASASILALALIITGLCFWVRSERHRLRVEKRRMRGEIDEHRVHKRFEAQQLRRERQAQRARNKRRFSIRRFHSKDAVQLSDRYEVPLASATPAAAPNGQFYGTSDSAMARSAAASKQRSLGRVVTDRSDPSGAQNTSKHASRHASRHASEPRSRVAASQSRLSSQDRTPGFESGRQSPSLGVHRAQTKPVSRSPHGSRATAVGSQSASRTPTRGVQSPGLRAHNFMHYGSA